MNGESYRLKQSRQTANYAVLGLTSDPSPGPASTDIYAGLLDPGHGMLVFDTPVVCFSPALDTPDPNRTAELGEGFRRANLPIRTLLLPHPRGARCQEGGEQAGC